MTVRQAPLQCQRRMVSQQPPGQATPAAAEPATPTPTATCVAVYLGRSSSRRSSPRLAASVFAYLPHAQQATVGPHTCICYNLILAIPGGVNCIVAPFRGSQNPLTPC